MTKSTMREGASRREILQAGVAGALAMATPLTAVASPASAGRLEAAVYDERFAEAAAFGAQMARRGVPVHAIRADITPFYNSLHQRWKEGPTLIAGLSSAASLFALELMARGAEMRVALKAEQRMGRSGQPEWLLEGPQALIDIVARGAPGLGWGGTAARLAAACPAQWTSPVRTTAPCAAATSAGLDERLTAWVIAPVIRI